MTSSKALLSAAAGAAMMIGMAGAAHAQETVTSWKGAPQFQNDTSSFKVRGRILIDAVMQDIDREGAGIDFKTRNIRGRQVFLGVEGAINNYFYYKIEGGAVNGGAWGWDDAVLEYKPNDMTSVMVGNIKVAGLENLTSTRFTTFMDRGPYGDMGVDSYLLGGVVKVNGLNWSVTGGIQGASLNSTDVTAATANNGNDVEERLAYTVRGHFTPIDSDTTKVHLGASARYRDGGSELLSYSARPNTAVSTVTPLNTGSISDADMTWAVEGAVVFKSFSAQAEYSDIKFERFCATNLTGPQCTALGPDGDLKVGYAFLSWWPTGEMRAYDAKKGEFGRPKILNPITAGGMGGVELAIRYDWADTTEARNVNPAAPTDAGEYTAWTIGANYYPHPYVRVMANYTKGQVDNQAAGRDFDVDTFQLRAQLDF
jgi:phosphate-selective porin OprO/OprP